MQIGDLICYNVGGMKYKTLGLVIDIGGWFPYGESHPVVLIQWCMIGRYMPRMERPNWKISNRTEMVVGVMTWHRAGDWFEVVQ